MALITAISTFKMVVNNAFSLTNYTTLLVCGIRNCLETGNPTFVSRVNSKKFTYKTLTWKLFVNPNTSNSCPALQIGPRPSFHPNHTTHTTALVLQWPQASFSLQRISLEVIRFVLTALAPRNTQLSLSIVAY